MLSEPSVASRVARVLLVEDDDDHADLALGSLVRAGVFAVDRVDNGAEALARAAGDSYDALVVDYRLGDMDGLAVLAQLRATGTTTPVLLLTSQGSERLAAEAVRARADDYLSKDLGLAMDGLGRAVLAMLERRRLADALARARDEFFAAASHDLKNPLSGIKMTAELLRRRNSGQGATASEQLLKGLDAIENASTRMLAQIEELLDVARLQVGRPLELQPRDMDLVALTRQAVAIHQYATERHHMQVTSTQTQVMGCWDAPRLERVVGNLLNNAIKYSPRGGPISISIDVECAGMEPSAVLVIRDEGIGIAASELPHIHELFQRAEAVRGEIPGTGIGLATVRHIVELHGGSVSIASQEGKGTTVTIRLPLRRSAPVDDSHLGRFPV
jgi:signal transduction histidine kinase